MTDEFKKNLTKDMTKFKYMINPLIRTSEQNQFNKIYDAFSDFILNQFTEIDTRLIKLENKYKYSVTEETIEGIIKRVNSKINECIVQERSIVKADVKYIFQPYTLSEQLYSKLGLNDKTTDETRGKSE
jgi:hypothetical protein